MFSKVLIANRGEIALRVIRACRELGVKTAVIYSEADLSSLPVKMADEAHLIGLPSPADSYLKLDEIVETAVRVGAEAIHPGYGFLAENSNFAEACERKGIAFIGPPSKTLAITGNKLKCKALVADQGISTIPAHDGVIEDQDSALKVAREMGFPVLMKSIYGGGGRGIRIARSKEELIESFKPAQLEALTSFGRFGIYMERFFEKARHIEVQVLLDHKGNALHLGERECSIQRRYQKLVELSPSPAVDEELRTKMGNVALRIGKALGYSNAGTMEFLVDRDERFYFMEVNARLQVEHPVTEFVTGVDLVKSQLRIASGEELWLSQDDLRLRGCALECRINAEDPAGDFLPSAGVIDLFHPPSGPGIRVETALYTGYRVPPYYDSLIAKLIAWGESFEEARARMRNALFETRIEGVKTTIPLHSEIIDDDEFARGNLSTDFIDNRHIVERMLKRIERDKKFLEEAAAILAAIPMGGSKPVRSASNLSLQVKIREVQTGSRERFVDWI